MAATSAKTSENGDPFTEDKIWVKPVALQEARRGTHSEDTN